MADPKRITAADVIANLKVWFTPRQYAFLEQLAPGTGARNYRWADAVAMSVWPSRGYDIHGIEVKVSRYDWKQELAQPEKSAAVQKYCNRWWVATPDESIVHPGELPPTWGHLVMKGATMRAAVAAPPLEPSQVSIEFVASILRNVQTADEVGVQNRINEAVKKSAEDGRDYLQKQYRNLKKQCDEFESASGIRLDSYSDGKELGEAVETLRSMKWKTERIASAIQECKEISSMLERIQALSTLREEIPA